MRAGPSPTNAVSVDFTVTFSEDVTGVDSADFGVSYSGVSGVSVTNVAGSGSVYTVTVHTGTGDGTIKLMVSDDDSIIDAGGNPLSGSYGDGETYTIDKTEPSVASLSPADRATDVQLDANLVITFTEDVQGCVESGRRCLLGWLRPA